MLPDTPRHSFLPFSKKCQHFLFSSFLFCLFQWAIFSSCLSWLAVLRVSSMIVFACSLLLQIALILLNVVLVASLMSFSILSVTLVRWVIKQSSSFCSASLVACYHSRWNVLSSFLTTMGLIVMRNLSGVLCL